MESASDEDDVNNDEVELTATDRKSSWLGASMKRVRVMVQALFVYKRAFAHCHNRSKK